MPEPTARRALYLALMTDGVAGRGHSPDRSEQATALIEAFRDEILARHRAQVLTEGAALIRADAEERRKRSYSDNAIFELVGGRRAADVLLAARRTPDAPSDAR